jgi:hypothetical protein
MSMPSLESSIRTCKVDTAWDNRAQSDRFLNPAQMSCPTWSGFDLTGRKVCPDSFYTKAPGCNSAEDRVVVENNVSRPQYMEYITLNAGGVQGNMYGNQLNHQSLMAADKNLIKTMGGRYEDQRLNRMQAGPPRDRAAFAEHFKAQTRENYRSPGGPDFGLGMKANVIAGCGYAPYAQSQATLSQWDREAKAAQCLHGSAQRRACAGGM